MRRFNVITPWLITATWFILFSPCVAADDAVIVFAGWNYAGGHRNWDIYRTSLSGDSKVVVGSPASEVYPFAFPGGKEIGYLVEKPNTEVRQIFKVDLESGATADLGISIRASTTCQVSPDAQQLACADSGGGHNQIVLFDLASKQKRQITNLRNDCLDPSWSPDGKNLVYWTGNLPDQVGKEAKPKGNHLVVYNFETGENRLLTKAIDAYDAYPRWSPDGAWIAFHRKGKSRGEWNIWMVRPDGSEETQLTTGKLESAHSTWSPDSKQIAYQCYRPKPDAYDICAVEVATKNVISVTNTDKMDEQHPVWIK